VVERIKVKFMMDQPPELVGRDENMV